MHAFRNFFLTLLVSIQVVAAERPDYLHSGNQIVFLGDSITAAGDFIAIVDAHLRMAYGEDIPDLINLGLPSETCTGLSEPDHPFPRPDVHERLDRALEKAIPDVVIACYGMNDGIYYPFDQERFKAYQAGIRKIVRKVEAAGAKCLLLAPPAFDPQPYRKAGKLLPKGAEKYAWLAIYEGYDRVIQQYADWVMSDPSLGVQTVNVHDPIRDYLIEIRKEQPDFAMSNDGVHINRDGHRLIAQGLLREWGVPINKALPKALVDLTHQRHQILHDSWLSHVGHKRPGGKAGLPLLEAEKRAIGLEVRIRELLP
jgi:lysophospholipase L1-like esterase